MRKTTYRLSQTTTSDLAIGEVAPCASCASEGGGRVFGQDVDGFVLCNECRSPLSYCDVGGQG